MTTETSNQTLGAEESSDNPSSLFISALTLAARADRIGLIVTRIALVIVLCWIGGLKVAPYEAEGIVPFVANSPLMSFLLNDPTHYQEHRTPEGALNPANQAWNEQNGTYRFAYALGTCIVIFGLMIALHPFYPQVAAIGSFLLVGMSFTTLSFLITTPECWVAPNGGAEHGFPYLAGPGRLVIKDVIMMGAAIVTMADSAKAYLRKQALTNS